MSSWILNRTTNAKAVIAENNESYEDEYEQFDQAAVAFHDEYIIAFLVSFVQQVIHRVYLFQYGFIFLLKLRKLD